MSFNRLIHKSLLAVTHFLLIRITGPCWQWVAVREDIRGNGEAASSHANRPLWCAFSSRSIFPSQSSSWAACGNNEQSLETQEPFTPDARPRQLRLLSWVRCLMKRTADDNPPPALALTPLFCRWNQSDGLRNPLQREQLSRSFMKVTLMSVMP